MSCSIEDPCTTTAKYRCSGASCVRDDINGSFTNSYCDNMCESARPLFYSCNGSSCVYDPYGSYTTSDCNNQCGGGVVVSDGCVKTLVTASQLPLMCQETNVYDGLQHVCGDGYVLDKEKILLSDTLLSTTSSDDAFLSFCKDISYTTTYRNSTSSLIATTSTV